ncbi:GAF domain-containing protein [Mycobacterium sp. SMC-4]|uniref:GAF domain-containing protein n=1 Tax=Mycobacterium sp. SMC-4 TaxID=2857059 RepID=UPI003CFFA727
MAVHLPKFAKFDEWLNKTLDEQAKASGEDVQTYIARSVGSRILHELKRDKSPLLEEARARLVASGVFDAEAMPDVSEAVNNPDRLQALYATGLLDTPPEEAYDRITRTAADALNAPYSAFSLIDQDRQFFKSTAGMDTGTEEKRQTPLADSVCQYAVANGAPLVIDDMRIDPVFRNHPAVLDGTVVAYLGIPLIDRADNAIGTLCVFDTQPRQWSAGHVQVLSDLAALTAERVFGH